MFLGRTLDIKIFILPFSSSMAFIAPSKIFERPVVYSYHIARLHSILYFGSATPILSKAYLPPFIQRDRSRPGR